MRCHIRGASIGTRRGEKGDPRSKRRAGGLPADCRGISGGIGCDTRGGLITGPLNMDVSLAAAVPAIRRPAFARRAVISAMVIGCRAGGGAGLAAIVPAGMLDVLAAGAMASEAFCELEWNAPTPLPVLHGDRRSGEARTRRTVWGPRPVDGRARRIMAGGLGFDRNGWIVGFNSGGQGMRGGIGLFRKEIKSRNKSQADQAGTKPLSTRPGGLDKCVCTPAAD